MGRLAPEEFSRQDLMERGSSVQRAEYWSEQARRAWIADRELRGKMYLGEADALVSDVRSILDSDGATAFEVHEDADCPNAVAHAVIKVARQYTPSQVKKIREHLSKVFNNVVIVEQANQD